MYSDGMIRRLTAYISTLDGINNKDELKEMVKDEFHLTTDRSVYYCDEFAIRFSKSQRERMSNTVLSLSALLKYDDRPVIECIVTPQKNYQLLMNTTFLKKISHSSQELRMDNIKGSINGGDIMYEIDGIENKPSNFRYLFAYHEAMSEEENLERLVEATNGIQGRVEKTEIDSAANACIMRSVERAAEFLNSPEYQDLFNDLNSRVTRSQNEIAIASLIDNVNVRGRVIEFLITDNGSSLKDKIVSALNRGESIPEFTTRDGLGDFGKEYASYNTETDIKTKVMYLNSNPKAYNVDKLLKFLMFSKSVYMLYIIGIDDHQNIVCRLVSAFDNRLLDHHTRIIHHWTGRNSRGVAQFDGESLEDILQDNSHSEFDIARAKAFVQGLIDR